MGAKQSSPSVTPFSSDASFRLVCDPCINQDKPAKAWCGQCNVYLCQLCANKHTRKHGLSTGEHLPTTLPKPESLTNNVLVKQIRSVDTLQDSEGIINNTVLEQDRKIKGCVSIGDHIVTITNKQLKLHDEYFHCIWSSKLTFVPNAVSAQGNYIAISFNRGKVNNEVDVKQSGPTFKDVLAFELQLANCTSPIRLKQQRGFETAGECFTLSYCPLKEEKQLILAIGIKVDSYNGRDDLKYLVQIVRSNGNVMQTLDYNQRGEPCIDGKFFISGTQNFGEVVISEIREKRVRGIDMKIGKTVFEFEGGSPQGLAMDDDDNIYVYNESVFYWIPPLRNKIHFMKQTYTKKKSPNKMASPISFNSETRILYVTNNETDTVQTYWIS